MRRDHEDLEKIAEKLRSASPFSNETSLRNVITGVDANDDANVHDLFPIGKEVLAKMEGEPVFSSSSKRI